MSQWLIKWAEKLEKASGGRLVFKHFPGSQMGPTRQHYDFARTGQADVVLVPARRTPGRFPLTEIIQLPYLVGSAEIGTKVLNDRRAAREISRRRAQGRQGAAAAHAPAGQRAHHQEADPHRRRHEGPAACASPRRPSAISSPRSAARRSACCRPSRSSSCRRARIDGTFIDYGGAGIAFKMGGTLKYSTEMYSYVSSFGVGMNPDFWAKLPPDLQELVTKSMAGVEKEVGEAWDALDVPGKKALIDGGGEAIKLSPAENAKFRKIGAEVAEAKVKELEGKGMPARAVYTHDEGARREARQDLEELLELRWAEMRWRDLGSTVCGCIAAACSRRDDAAHGRRRDAARVLQLPDPRHATS